MSKVTQYVKDSFAELREHVTWPTFSELQSNAVVVIVASVIIALLVFLMNQASTFLLQTFVYPG